MPKKCIFLLLLGRLMLTAPLAAVAAGGEEPSESIALTVWTPVYGQSGLAGADEAEIRELLEQHTGYKIDWTFGSPESEFERLLVSVASGEAPDMLSQVPPEYYQPLVEQGVLLPLNDLVDAFPSVSEDLWSKATANGTVYGVPQEVRNGSVLIRQDWLEQSGLGAPATVDDFVNVLRKFKEAHPEAAPMTGVPSTVWGRLSPFCEKYGTCVT